MIQTIVIIVVKITNLKSNNSSNKTENTNIFSKKKKNKINYDLNNYFINSIYDSNRLTIRILSMNNNILNNKITSIKNANVSNYY